MSKEFVVSMTCPSCGKVSRNSRTEQDMRDEFGNSDTLSVLCTHCQANYEQPMALACAEWDDYCREIPLPADV